MRICEGALCGWRADLLVCGPEMKVRWMDGDGMAPQQRQRREAPGWGWKDALLIDEFFAGRPNIPAAEGLGLKPGVSKEKNPKK